MPEKCSNACDLYALAHEYQINELSEQIQWHISVKVNRENATTLLKFGVLYDDHIIKRTAFQAIEESNESNESNVQLFAIDVAE